MSSGADLAKRNVHEAIGELLDEGEIAINWCLIVDVAGPDNVRYIAHRSGGGADGDDAPMAWVALGMLQAGVDTARDQLRDMTYDDEDEDGDEGEGEDGD